MCDQTPDREPERSLQALPQASGARTYTFSTFGFQITDVTARLNIRVPDNAWEPARRLRTPPSPAGECAGALSRLGTVGYSPPPHTLTVRLALM